MSVTAVSYSQHHPRLPGETDVLKSLLDATLKSAPCLMW